MLMTTLIKITNGILSISDEALLIKPLRMIYNKDRTKDKEEYMQAASYLYFMYDPRSDYMYITDDNERDRIIIETEGLIKVKKDALLKEAVEKYKCPSVSIIIRSRSLSSVKKDALLKEAVEKYKCPVTHSPSDVDTAWCDRLTENGSLGIYISI